MKNSANRGAGMRHLACLLASTTLACISLAGATTAHATTVSGGSGLLGTFGGPKGPGDSTDLDAKSATAQFDSQNIFLSATMKGDIGLTAAKSKAAGGTDQGVYVWGVDRGSGKPVLDGPTPLPTDTNPPIGSGVNFDAFIVLQDLANGHGDGFVALIGSDGNLVAPPQALAANAISYSGATINLVIPISMLPANPLPGHTVDVADYGYNIWPRLNGISSNKLVASFLPANSDFFGSAVPEPATWAMMITGFGLVGTAMRRRRLLPAT